MGEDADFAGQCAVVGRGTGDFEHHGVVWPTGQPHLGLGSNRQARGGLVRPRVLVVVLSHVTRPIPRRPLYPRLRAVHVFSSSPRLHIALMCPEIPQNTGNIGRLCLAIGARLHLVHPLGFATNAKAVRRAGLDYWAHVDVVEHNHMQAFCAWCGSRPVFGFSTSGSLSYTAAPYVPGCVLLFGSESKGLPQRIHHTYPMYTIPMPGSVRSLNLANSASIVAYQALQALEPQLFQNIN